MCNRVSRNVTFTVKDKEDLAHKGLVSLAQKVGGNTYKGSEHARSFWTGGCGRDFYIKTDVTRSLSPSDKMTGFTKLI